MGGVKSHAISIHSLHTEGDLLTGGEGKRIFSFQSTPSTRRETVRHVLVCAAGCDFNPLPPHGGRRPPAPLWGATEKFQSTPSAWRETKPTRIPRHRKRISIHSLRMEGDGIRHFWKRRSEHFNPLPPYGGRRHHLFAFRRSVHFNPLPPYGGRRCGKRSF